MKRIKAVMILAAFIFNAGMTVLFFSMNGFSLLFFISLLVTVLMYWKAEKSIYALLH